MVKRFEGNDWIRQPTKPIESETQMSTSDYLVAFSGLANSYCIGLVDMVNSTKISADMNEIEWCKYYEVFLNSLAKVLQRYGGKVIKNQGDSLLYYFPESSNASWFSLEDCLESALVMIEERESICKTLKKFSLPPINYRVSMDYGKVVIMKSSISSIPDLIGPPVNMCAKINHLASSNGIVIGGDFFQYVKEFKKYRYSQKKGFSIGLKFPYPVYGLTRT